MQDERIVAGLDIGTTKVCAIVGRINEFGQLEVLGMGKAPSEGVKDGAVSNINKTVAGITQAIREAEDNSKIEINVVNVGIAGKHIKSSLHHGSITRKSSEEEITADDVLRLNNDMFRIVTEPGTEIVHVIPQQYTVDYEEHIKDPIGMAGVKLEADFHVITAQSNSIKNIRKCVERAGLEIESVVLEPLASCMSVLSKEEKEAGVVIVDIGGGTTDVAIYHDGIVRHTAVIPFGGNIVTSDIRQGCAVMQEQAELLKVKFGRSLAEEAAENEVISIPGLRNRPPKEISVKNLACIIEARMEEVAELVMVEIERSGYRNRLAGGIVITGGGAQLSNVQQLFEYKIGLDARIGYPNEHLGKTRHEEIKTPMYATSVGLVLAGFHSVGERDVPTLEQPLARPQQTSSFKGGGDFFQNLFRRTRSFLIDDFEDGKKGF